MNNETGATPRLKTHLLLAATMISLVFIQPYIAECAEDNSNTAVAIRGTHPRLHVDPELLGQIKALMDKGDPIWNRFYDAVNRKNGVHGDIEGGEVTSYMLAHLITGKRQYFDSAWGLIKDKIYRNGSDRSGGLKTIVDIYKDDHNAGYQGGAFIGTVALLYDWGFDQLTPEQRKDLADWMYNANDYNHNRSHYSKSYFRNDGIAITYGIASAAYATFGEDDRAGLQLDWFRGNWKEIIKALDIMGKGGALGEGNAYGTAPTGFNLARIANMVYYASGEDLFLSHPWFKKRLAYDAFATYPGTIGGPGSTVKYGWPGVMLEQASIGGDGRRGASWHSGNLRPLGLILSRRFSGTEEAGIWNWVYRQPAVDKAVSGADSFYDLLYYSPRPKLIKPEKHSYFDPSMGYIYIRSDWGSPDSTWISFMAGPHIDTHEHLDQGSFTIFKRRDLLPKTGNYDYDIKGGEHVAYYTRTVSSNGILIGDPDEIFRGFIAGVGCDKNGDGSKIKSADMSDACPPNDGGQRTMHPLGLSAGTPDNFKVYRDVFDTARVVYYEDNDDAVKWVADITNAYNNPRYSTPGNSPKVSKVYRRFVYLKEPDILVVADTVESTNAKFEKKVLFHALERITIDAKAESIDEGESAYNGIDQARIVIDDTDPADKYQDEVDPKSGKLFSTVDLRKGYATLLIKTLFPEKFEYHKIGGRVPADTVHEPDYTSDRYKMNTGHYHRHIKDFWVKDYSEGVIPHHKSENWEPKQPLEVFTGAYIPSFSGGYGRWRLEVIPTVQSKTDYFLNVLKPALDADVVMPPMKKLETGGTFGVEIDSGGKIFSVTFSKDALDPPAVVVTS